MAYTFVLVHGSWHDNRPWQPVIERLEQNGHKVYAPTVAGHAPGDRKDVTHADCVRSVVDFIKDKDIRDFILVGHSFGGTVIQPVAEQVSDRVRRLVFWNAFVLLDGQSLEDNVPPHYKELFDAARAARRRRDAALPDLARCLHQRCRRGARHARPMPCCRRHRIAAIPTRCR